MTFNSSMTGKWKALKLAAAAAVVGLPMMAASAQQVPGYGEVEPQAATPTWSAAQSSLDRDRNALIDARHRADDLAAQRDQQQRMVDSLRNGGSAPAAAPSTLTTGDAKALQQQFDDAKAKADKIHDDAVARFEQTDAWRSEFAKFDQARKDLKGPTDAVLNQASQARDFQDLVNAAKAAKERADKLHEDKSADPKTVREADDAFVAADNRVQEAAERALKADPHVADLRKTVDASKAHLDEMRDKFEQDLINDPQFGPAVADVRAKQAALDAATGRTTATDPQLAGGSVPTGPDGLRDAQARLDQLNRDLDDARAETDHLTGRVRDDEQAMGLADSTTPQQQQTPPPSGDYQPQAPDYGYGAPPPQTDGGYGYGGDYGYGAEPAPYAVPVYGPAVVAQPYDWWSPYLSFGISIGSYHYHNYWCNDWYGRWCGPAYYGHSHGYYGYYGGHGHYYDHGYYDHGHDSGHGGYAYGGYAHHGSGYGYSTYGRGYGSYAYGGGNYGRGNRGGYYEGTRYGRGSGSTYASTGSYAYRGGASAGRSLSYYGSTSTYAGRSASRYESPLVAGGRSSSYADRYTGRSNYSTARDYPAYRSQAADRSAYESRVQRRSAESFASPRVSRGGAESTPSYRYQLSSPHATRSYAESRHSSASSASPRVESSPSYSGGSSRGGSESHSSGGSSSGREGGGGDHSGSSSHGSHSGGHSR